MKYYKISDLIDLKVIGNYPQIEEVKCYCDPIEDPLFIDNIGYKKIDFIPKTPIGILNKNVKLTDSLTSPCMGYTKKLIINDKFKSLLDKFGNGNFQAFRAEIEISKKENIFYWVLNPTSFNYEEIDFNNSEIFLLKDLFEKEEKLDISTLEVFNKEKERVEKIGYPYQFLIEKLMLNPKSNQHFIIIDNLSNGIGYFVSEKLKNEIEEKKITGIKFDEL